MPSPLQRWRVRQWWYFTTLPLAALNPWPWTAHVSAAASGAPMTIAAATAALPAAAGGVLSVAALLAFGYYANAIGDRDMDDSAMKNPLVGGVLPDGWRLELSALAALALAFAAARGAPLAVGAAAVSVVAGWSYSLGPRCKRLPLVGSLWNVAYFAPMMLVGVSPSVPSALAPQLVSFAGLLLGNQWLHEAADGEEDRRGALATTGLRFGPRVTAALALLVGVAALVTVQSVRSGAADRLAVAADAALALALAVAPVALALRGEQPVAMARARRVQRLLAACACACVYGEAWRHG